MASYIAHNLVEVTLASGGISASQTTIPLAAGEGVKLRSTSGSTYQYPGVVYSSLYSVPHLDPGWEIVLVTSHNALSDTVAVVTRGAEDSSTHPAVAHNATGVTYKLQVGFTRAMFEALGVAVQEDAVEVGTQIQTLNFANGPDVTNPSAGLGKLEFSTFGGFLDRAHHIASSYQASTIARKLYYPHYGSRHLGGATVAVGMSIYVSYFYLFCPERNGTIDEMMLMRATSGGSSGARFAVYDTVSATDLSCGLRLFHSGQIAIANDASGNAGSKWVTDPSAVSFRRGKPYYLAITLSGTNNVNGTNINSTMSYPQLVGADWVAVNNLIPLIGGQRDLALGTNYYDFGFPADMTAIQWTGTLDPTAVQTIWLHWAT